MLTPVPGNGEHSPAPVREPDPDRLPDAEPGPNPDENPDPPQHAVPYLRSPSWDMLCHGVKILRLSEGDAEFIPIAQLIASVQKDSGSIR